jgi:hypothetical protein
VKDSKEKRKEYNKFCHDVVAHRPFPMDQTETPKLLPTSASTSLECSPSRLIVYAILSRYMQSIVKVALSWTSIYVS